MGGSKILKFNIRHTVAIDNTVHFTQHSQTISSHY